MATTRDSDCLARDGTGSKTTSLEANLHSTEDPPRRGLKRPPGTDFEANSQQPQRARHGASEDQTVPSVQLLHSPRDNNALVVTAEPLGRRHCQVSSFSHGVIEGVKHLLPAGMQQRLLTGTANGAAGDRKSDTKGLSMGAGGLARLQLDLTHGPPVKHFYGRFLDELLPRHAHPDARESSVWKDLHLSELDDKDLHTARRAYSSAPGEFVDKLESLLVSLLAQAIAHQYLHLVASGQACEYLTAHESCPHDMALKDDVMPPDSTNYRRMVVYAAAVRYVQEQHLKWFMICDRVNNFCASLGVDVLSDATQEALLDHNIRQMRRTALKSGVYKENSKLHARIEALTQEMTERTEAQARRHRGHLYLSYRCHIERLSEHVIVRTPAGDPIFKPTFTNKWHAWVDQTCGNYWKLQQE